MRRCGSNWRRSGSPHSPDFIRRFSTSAILGANLSRSKRPTDPVLSLFRLCCDFAPVTHQSTLGD
jgi:hypothetical protein